MEKNIKERKLTLQFSKEEMEEEMVITKVRILNFFKVQNSKILMCETFPGVM